MQRQSAGFLAVGVAVAGLLLGAAPAATAAPRAQAAWPAAERAAGFSEQDARYLVAAHQTNLAEIAAGRDALVKATTAEVKAAARRFVRDHTALDTAVRELAGAGRIELPTEPAADHKLSFAKVSNKRGIEYDRAWVEQQMAAHDTNLVTTRKQVADGTAPGVVAAARNARPVIEAHMDLIESAAAAVGAELPVVGEDDPSSGSPGAGGAGGSSRRPPSRVEAGSGGQAALGDTTASVALMGAGAACLVAGGVVLLRRRRASA